MATPQVSKESQDLVKQCFGFLTDEHGFEITLLREDRGLLEVVFRSPSMEIKYYKFGMIEDGLELGLPGNDDRIPLFWFREYLGSDTRKPGYEFAVEAVFLRENFSTICEMASPANFKKSHQLLETFICERREEERRLAAEKEEKLRRRLASIKGQLLEEKTPGESASAPDLGFCVSSGLETLPEIYIKAGSEGAWQYGGIGPESLAAPNAKEDTEPPGNAGKTGGAPCSAASPLSRLARWFGRRYT